MTDLERAYQALSAKAAPYSSLFSYYRGKAPLVYTSQRLQEIFRNLDARFSENWCAMVIDSATDRIALTGLTAAGNADATLKALWTDCQLALVADDAHENALICGEAFVIAWPDADGKPRAFYNDPRMCHVFYGDEDPNASTLAAKWYDAIDGHRRLTLYYQDHLEYYVSRAKAESVTAASFEPLDPPSAVNPYDTIPVFHFRTRRDCRSDLENVLPIQNGINKLLMDMIVAAEYGAFKQRYIISQADVSNLKNAPNEVWLIPGADGMGQATQVGEFTATDLNIYLNAIDRLATHLAVISRTPKHYLFGQGGTPSGEALIAMESPLNHKCADYIERFKPTWKDLGAFLARLSKVGIDANGITPEFRNPQTVQPLTEAQILQAMTAANVPLVTALRRLGMSEAELKQMREDKAEEAGTQQASLASALVAAQRRLDQGNPTEPTGQAAPAAIPEAGA